MRFSANLGFLWTDRPLPDAVRAAKAAGFDAVECHWPFDTPVEGLIATLEQTGLPMLGLNTSRGDIAAGENGLAALPGREVDARAAIDQAIDYARRSGTKAVHVMAGKAEGTRARDSFMGNLRHALERAAPDGIDILIEPLNRFDAPGYFLHETGTAAEIIHDMGHPSLRLMFDCYHVHRTNGDVLEKLEALMPIIGHIQFAGTPGRGQPLDSDLDYREVFRLLSRLGYDRPIGAEYKPDGPTDDSLEWMSVLR